MDLSPPTAQPEPAHAFAIRHATEIDAPAVAEFIRAVFGPGRFARTAFRIRERVRPSERKTLITESEGRLIGSVTLVPVAVDRRNGFWLGPIAVAADMRKVGLGGALMGAALNFASDQNAEFVGLVGDPPFYERFGFFQGEPGTLKLPGPVDPGRVLVAPIKSVVMPMGWVRPRPSAPVKPTVP